MEGPIVKQLYPTAKPALNDIVVADIQSIQDTAVYARLPGYSDLEVMLPITEINVRKHRKVSDYVRIGELTPLCVIRVEDAGVDVSLKMVSETEKAAALDDYHKRLRIDQVLRVAAHHDPAVMRGLYEAHVWNRESINAVWSRFEEIRAAEGDELEGLTEPRDLVTAIHQKFPPAVHIAEREVILRFGLDPAGAARVSAALRDLAAMEGVQVFVVAPPRYRIVVKEKTPARATTRLEEVCATIPAPV
jgi:translation initiation factor 2 alpha subunit (eIF-2alpha)